MRGIMSEGMIMCANVPEKVEIIEPPPGAAIGDRVIVEGYPGGIPIVIYFDTFMTQFLDIDLSLLCQTFIQ